MNLNYNKTIPIRGDASFRKFYRRKNKHKTSIIVYANKEKEKNLLNYDAINKLLLKNKIDVLFDDTDERLSAKFKKFDLIGIPYQIILGSKSTDDKFEFKEVNGKTETISLEEIKNKLINRRNLN